MKALIALAIVLSHLHTAMAQSAPPPRPSRPGTTTIYHQTIDSHGNWLQVPVAMVGGKLDRAARQKVDEARKRLVGAETDQDKLQAVDSLREALTTYFAADVSRRNKELDHVRERVAKMESHLNSRISARAEIVDLQLKSFEFEADGLGMFDDRVAANPAHPIALSIAGDSVREGDNSKRSELLRRVRRLRAGLRTAQHSARPTLLQELKQVMQEYFDEDIKTRTTALDAIKKRVANLEKQLAMRVQAEQRIIDLQLEIFQKEAEGLGFFGGAGTTSRLSFRRRPAAHRSSVGR